MTAEVKIAQNKLTLLQLAEKIRNVSEACRRRGVSRSQFYEYKRAFQEKGFEGLKDLPPIPKSFPNETPAEVKKKVIDLSIRHPAWGSVRISDHLQLEGISVSSSTVRNLWLKEGLETKYTRILRLEGQTQGKEVELTEEQIRLLEKANRDIPTARAARPIDTLCSATRYDAASRRSGGLRALLILDPSRRHSQDSTRHTSA
ncbi:MAG: helix-turn-helix domain containing protein [Candidatus Zixiibacteriota bacterium]|nr:MAG: helix-turn-helix domain containing protein [candidate division Zixibacteria bacterium]